MAFGRKTYFHLKEGLKENKGRDMGLCVPTGVDRKFGNFKKTKTVDEFVRFHSW